MILKYKKARDMLNPLAINPIGVYQQLVQQAAHNIPHLLPVIQKTDAIVSTRHVDELPFDLEQSQQIALHTVTDYSPWLRLLYQHWQLRLIQNLGNHPHPKPTDDMHWHPESTAKLLNGISLAYAGWLWHKAQLPLPETVERITQLWRDTWLEFNVELKQAQLGIGVVDALNKTADLFHQFWLESWLHLAQLQGDVPTANNDQQAPLS
jgi:hypothetical protein